MQFGGGGGRIDILAFYPLIEIMRRDQGKRVCRDERKPMLTNFKVFGHLMTSQVSTMTENNHVFFVHNFWTERARTKIRTLSCSSRRECQNIYDLTPKAQSQNLTSGHVTSRSSWVNRGKYAYHSMRLDEFNTMRPCARVYLFSVRSYGKKSSWP